jgi:hypothetical protein
LITLTAEHYEKTFYKEALKTGFFDYQVMKWSDLIELHAFSSQHGTTIANFVEVMNKWTKDLL